MLVSLFRNGGRVVVQLSAVALVCVGLQMRAPAADHHLNALVGTWRLVDYVDTPQGGKPIHAFGTSPIGLFIFTADGHASISIMRNPPRITTASTDQDPDACIPGWYCAYFGTYTVNSKGGVWVTHVLGGNIPSFLNTDQTRAFTIHANKLVISGRYLQSGRRVEFKRVLVRSDNK